MRTLSQKAAIFARKAHQGKIRKFTKNTPYFFHPAAVARLIICITADEYIIAAAYLHDVVEDTDVTYDEIKEEFGVVVADMVRALTKPDGFPTKIQADIAYRIQLAEASADVHTIKCADIADNLREIANADFQFAERYVPEKEKYLSTLEKSDPVMKEYAENCLATAKAHLEGMRDAAAGI